MGAHPQDPMKSVFVQSPLGEARPLDIPQTKTAVGAQNKLMLDATITGMRMEMLAPAKRPDVFEGGKHYVWCPGCRRYIKDKTLFGTLHLCG